MAVGITAWIFWGSQSTQPDLFLLILERSGCCSGCELAQKARTWWVVASAASRENYACCGSELTGDVRRLPTACEPHGRDGLGPLLRMQMPSLWMRERAESSKLWRCLHRATNCCAVLPATHCCPTNCHQRSAPTSRRFSMHGDGAGSSWIFAGLAGSNVAAGAGSSPWCPPARPVPECSPPSAVCPPRLTDPFSQANTRWTSSASLCQLDEFGWL